MVNTVRSANSRRIVCWMRSSVSRSTAAVASSRTRILLSRSSARAKHNNCRWPTLWKSGDCLNSLILWVVTIDLFPRAPNGEIAWVGLTLAFHHSLVCRYKLINCLGEEKFWTRFRLGKDGRLTPINRETSTSPVCLAIAIQHRIWDGMQDVYFIHALSRAFSFSFIR